MHKHTSIVHTVRITKAYDNIDERAINLKKKSSTCRAQVIARIKIDVNGRKWKRTEV